MNRRVDIREDIKRYQETLSYASSNASYSVGENIYMLPSDMNLKINPFLTGGGGGQNAPPRVFAKYLKNGFADLHKTL